MSPATHPFLATQLGVATSGLPSMANATLGEKKKMSKGIVNLFEFLAFMRGLLRPLGWDRARQTPSQFRPAASRRTWLGQLWINH